MKTDRTNKVKIITDGCSDIPKEWRFRYDIDCVPLTLSWAGEDRTVTCDWDAFSSDEFYGAMRGGVNIKASHASAKSFEEVFGKYAGKADIVYVGGSSALSKSFDTGAEIAAKIVAENPDADIRCVDTKAVCGAQALIAVEAAKLAASGMSAEDITARVEDLSRNVLQVGTTDTLEYLKNTGRVKASSAFFGNLFGIKPIIGIDVTGNNYVIKKIKGRYNAINECVETLKKNICYTDNPMPASEQTIYIGHADCADDAEYCAERVKKEICPKDIHIDIIGSAVGAIAGPTMLALFGFGKPITAIRKKARRQ